MYMIRYRFGLMRLGIYSVMSGIGRRLMRGLMLMVNLTLRWITQTGDEQTNQKASV